jgi:excisionase family DNA binding protein
MQDKGETPTGTIPDTSRYKVISVAEAAIRLNVTQDAIRKRLQRGTLPGIKTGQTWDVIETEELAHATPPASRDGPDTVSGRPEDVSVAPDNSLVGHLRDEVASRDDVIADLRARLDWAQTNVDAKDRLLSDVLADLARQRERTDMLQAQYHQAGERIRQLEAGASGEPPDESPSKAVGSPESDETPLKGIRRWLERIRGK